MTIDAAVVLAAGEGTRMKSKLPKVLHEIAGRSLLGYVLAAAAQLDCKELRVVVGSGRELVEDHLLEISNPKSGAKHIEKLASKKVSTFFQEVRRGTGDAVAKAIANFDDESSILILAGDTPLITGGTLESFVAAHIESKRPASILSAKVDDPFGYGRIIRTNNEFNAIVEQRDATLEQAQVNEINTGVYIIRIKELRAGLSKISTNNSQGELYLTDVFKLINEGAVNNQVNIFCAPDSNEFLGINDRAQLQDLTNLYQARRNKELMLSGVTIVSSVLTWVGPDVEIENDVTILPGTLINGKTKIKSGAVIGPRSTLTSVIVEKGATIRDSNVAQSFIGENAEIGPYSYIRPGTTVEQNAKVGAYVEVKSSTIGAGSKVPHLSYVGDAEIGSGSNIGAATIFVNYDGVEKHKSKVGNNVRVGSDSMIIAPVEIGDGAYTAAGSVITEDVPAGSMAVARAKQRNITGWVLRKRKGTDSEHSARAAGATE